MHADWVWQRLQVQQRSMEGSAQRQHCAQGEQLACLPASSAILSFLSAPLVSCCLPAAVLCSAFASVNDPSPRFLPPYCLPLPACPLAYLLQAWEHIKGREGQALETLKRIAAETAAERQQKESAATVRLPAVTYHASCRLSHVMHLRKALPPSSAAKQCRQRRPA